ncbi:hypothetical protein ACTXIU_14180 [Glutamicibacter arilaitensis]|uniref:hypothetical protein n=1 Tax=Glutamicibacter arilaitensis TaxID=256701 RepID=UPI003FD2BB50
MPNSDDQLDAWLVSGIQKKERRANAVQPSSDRLVSNDPGNGEAALTAIASWLGTRPKLPIVEFANLSRRTVTLTFAEPAVLPDPWVAPNDGTREANSTWGITLEHAQSLPQAEAYGWQFSGLTGIGTLADQSRALLNTTRWEILGLAGTPQWTHTLMLTQVMNQAAEPWSNDHDIWLVGYGETGDKLMNFLSAYHPVHRLHSVEDIGDIAPKDLRSGCATIYVMDADSHTLNEFISLDMSGIGLITDRIVSDKAMFLTERENKAAAIGPFNINLEIFPNYMPDLIDAMDKAWEANAKLAADQVAQADFDKFLSDQDPNSHAPNTAHASTEDPNEEALPVVEMDNASEEFELAQDLAAAEKLLAEEWSDGESENVMKSIDVDEPEDDSSDEIEESASKSESLDVVAILEPRVSDTRIEFADQEPSDSIALDSAADSSAVEVEACDGRPESLLVQEAGDDATISPASSAEESEEENIAAESDFVEASEPQPALSLFGKVSFNSGGKVLTGRNAEVLALLKLTSDPLTPQAVSELLWPGDDSSGNSARVRRTRLLAKVREVAGDKAIDSSGEHWILNDEVISSDLELLASYLEGDINSGEVRILPLLEDVGSPLVGAANWAAPYRSQIIAKATEILSEAVTKSLDQDAFAVAKAAQLARKKLEEI